MVEGQPVSTNSLSVEHILLSEALPRKDAFVLGTQAAPNSPGTMSAVSSMLTETSITHTEAEQDNYVSQGLAAFGRGAATAGEQVLNTVAIPLLQRAGNAAIMTGATMALNAITGRGGIPGVNSNPARLAL